MPRYGTLYYILSNGHENIVQALGTLYNIICNNNDDDDDDITDDDNDDNDDDHVGSTDCEFVSMTMI